MVMLDELRMYIEQYDKVIWVEDEEHTFTSLLRGFCVSKSIRDSLGKNKVLILSVEIFDIPKGIFDYHILSIEEQEEIRTLYQMYEFSDCFLHLSRSSLYGGLYNYVDTGCLSKEEMFEAILW